MKDDLATKIVLLSIEPTTMLVGPLDGQTGAHVIIHLWSPRIAAFSIVLPGSEGELKNQFSKYVIDLAKEGDSC